MRDQLFNVNVSLSIHIANRQQNP